MKRNRTSICTGALLQRRNVEAMLHYVITVLLLAVTSFVQAQNVPAFTLHTTKEAKVFFEEPNFVQLADSKNEGDSRIYWSATFNMYHTAVITRENYQLHAFCHCTLNNVRQVNFYFKRVSGSIAMDEEKLEVLINLPSQARWPTFNQDYAETKIEFDQEKGATLILIFSKTTPDMRDMSGTLRCELITQQGDSLRSASLDIFDVREAVSKLSPLVQIMPEKDTQIFASGVAQFKPVKDVGSSSESALPENMMQHMQRLVKYIVLDFKWIIAEEDKNFENNVQYNVKSTLFDKTRKMEMEEFGMYYIKDDATLFVNMESTKGGHLRNILNREGRYTKKNTRSVLMLMDDSSTVGSKYYVRPFGDVTTWTLKSPKNLPLLVEPLTLNVPKTTFIRNRDHNMKCGFIAENSPEHPLTVEWLKDNVPQMDLLKKDPLHGIRIGDSRVGMMLDLRDVKLSANGVWECRLRGTDLRGSYQLMVQQFPSFGDNNRGRPPKMIFAMENSDIKVRCAVRSFDAARKSVVPQFQVENVPFETFCLHGQQPRNAALCDLRNMVTIYAATAQPHEDSYVKAVTYSIKNLPYLNAATKQKMNHVVDCLATGSYIKQNDLKTDVSAIASTSINVIPRLTKDTFDMIEISGCSEVNPCRITQPKKFKCIIRTAYTLQLTDQHLIVRKYWKIGQHNQATIENLDEDSVLRKYTNFSSDGNILTIKEMHSQDDIKVMNDLGKVSCVIEIYYPSYITADQLKNFEVTGEGSIQPSNSSLFVPDNNARQSSGQMLYSTEYDSGTETFLTSALMLEGKPIVPVTTEAGLFIILPIVFVILLFVIIFVFSIYKCYQCNYRETSYLIGEKEISQGRNPEQELKNNSGFKPYDSSNNFYYEGKGFITKRGSIESEVIVGSDDDGELDDYDEPDTGKFNEDGSFIGNYSYQYTKVNGKLDAIV